MATKSKQVKLTPRQRQKYRIRKRLSGTEERPRITVFRSSKHVYAQAVSDVTGKTFVSASTKDKEVAGRISAVDSEVSNSDARSPKSVAAAWAVGQVLGERLKAANKEKAVFDRNGFVYHGRIRAIAEGVRSTGVKI